MATTRLWDGQDKYSQILIRIVRTAGLIMPVLVVGYGLLAWLKFIERSEHFSPWTFLLCSLSFVSLGIIQYFNDFRSKKFICNVIIGYHVLAASYLLLVTGFDSPLTICWLVLLFVSELFFGRIAFYYSAAALFATALFAYSLAPELSLSNLVEHLNYALLIVVAAIVAIKLRSVQNIQQEELEKTKVERAVQRDQLLTLVNNINESIVSISASGTIRVYNAAALNLLDTNQSLAGKNIDDVFSIYDQSGDPVSLVELLGSVSRSIERDDLSHRLADGEQIRLSMSVAPIRGAFSNQHISNEGYLFIFRDITKSKSLEEERDEFISVVSHELRTPITIAEGTLSNMQVLLERGMKPEELTRSLKDAHEQIVFLASMVNDLGTLSRAERGVGDEPEEIKVKDLLHELFSKYQPRAISEGLTLNLDAPARLGTIYTSELYLEEILQNFITNAIKYTKEGTVTIIAKKQKDGVYFAVKDTGIGMSKTDLKHIFEKFYRSEDYRTRETSGTGLGLYVVKKLARKLHVEIEVDSRLNHGSTFSFVIKDMKRS